MNNNDERIRNMLNSSEVPQELSPERIREMLDEKAPKKKRKNISKTVTRAVAGTAACAVIAGTSVYFAGQRNNNKFDETEASSNSIFSVNSSEDGSPERPDSILQGAESYRQIYNLLRTKALKEDLYSIFNFGNKYNNEYDYATDIAAEETDMAKDDANGIIEPGSTAANAPETEHKFSETYNQEENVLEADIVKTDGDCIYLVTEKVDTNAKNSWDYSCDPYLEIAQVDSGRFTDSAVIRISDALGLEDSEDFSHTVSVREMYLYNDMVVVLGTVCQLYRGAHDFEIYNGTCDCLCGGWYDSDISVFVSVYTKGTHPQLIGTYTQDGDFSDVRITPDGTMYIVSDYRSGQPSYVTKEYNYTEYIPEYGVNGDREFIPAEKIMLPPGGFTPNESLCYTVIGGVDLSETGKVANTDILSFTGNSGSVYCTTDNIYLACGYDKTKLTRIALTNGMITPVAEGSVEGYVKDQFSMSEYDGYFRIAVTNEKWVDLIEEIDESSSVASTTLSGTDNILYVMDMNFNEVGKLAGIGKGETIRSVSFSGSTAYIVTFRQTDPLFSIDISDPTSPKILDELKVTGFSSYMQQWQDGLLFGFGTAATETGSVTGYKLTMFDNSDPNSLRDLDTVEFDLWENNNEGSVSRDTEASYERKALLIAPEKNLIGLPMMIYTNSYQYGDDSHKEESVFVFYSFEDGKFVKRGELNKTSENYTINDKFRRAVYIDDHIYVVSASEFIAADIATITKTDSVSF